MTHQPKLPNIPPPEQRPKLAQLRVMADPSQVEKLRWHLAERTSKTIPRPDTAEQMELDT